jgi:hypothetical protein
MPGIRLHMSVARDLANDLQSPAIDDERGAYYLGATTPDIRALTRRDREETHFFKLDDFGQQDGVHRLFEREPALRDSHALDGQTAAFMAGYISHLVMDEDYITEIYRPLFGERSALSGDELADIMDKALQWDIERADCEDGHKMDEIRRALAEAAVAVNIDFIAREDLWKWRDVSLDIISQPMTADRFARFVARRLGREHLHDERHMAQFITEVPAILGRTWEHVGQERVREYLGGASARARAAMKEYLA